MPAGTYYLKGVAGFTSLDRPDKFGNYSVTVYLDEGSWKVFYESGMQLKPRIDDDGECVTFRRAPVKTSRKGETIEFGPAEVVDEKNQLFEAPNRIGRGSTVICKVKTYQAGDRIGHLLEKVMIEELVEREINAVKPDSVEHAF